MRGVVATCLAITWRSSSTSASCELIAWSHCARFCSLEHAHQKIPSGVYLHR